MWETIAIIVMLGGLEFILWLLNRRAAKSDREMQRKQLEILDGILTERSIQNSEDMPTAVHHQSEGGAANDNHENEIDDQVKKHSVCNRHWSVRDSESEAIAQAQAANGKSRLATAACPGLEGSSS